MRIRQGILTDSSSIIEFQKSMALETEGLALNHKTIEAGVQAVFKDATKGTYYVIESDHNVVGSLLLINEWSDWRNGYVKWIHSVYIKESHRKQGLFKSLYEHIKKLVENDPHLFGLRLYVDHSNVKAQKVYESLGMNKDHYQLYEWMK